MKITVHNRFRKSTCISTVFLFLLCPMAMVPSLGFADELSQAPIRGTANLTSNPNGIPIPALAEPPQAPSRTIEISVQAKGVLTPALDAGDLVNNITKTQELVQKMKVEYDRRYDEWNETRTSEARQALDEWVEMMADIAQRGMDSIEMLNRYPELYDLPDLPVEQPQPYYGKRVLLFHAAEGELTADNDVELFPSPLGLGSTFISGVGEVLSAYELLKSGDKSIDRDDSDSYGIEQTMARDGEIYDMRMRLNNFGYDTAKINDGTYREEESMSPFLRVVGADRIYYNAPYQAAGDFRHGEGGHMVISDDPEQDRDIGGEELRAYQNYKFSEMNTVITATYLTGLKSIVVTPQQISYYSDYKGYNIPTMRQVVETWVWNDARDKYVLSDTEEGELLHWIQIRKSSGREYVLSPDHYLGW